jgi:hypothetical protein
MTWHTQIDDRVLEGSEAALYLSAMQHAVEYLEEMADLEEEVDILALLIGGMNCPHPQPLSLGRGEPELLSPLPLGEG